MTMLNLLVGLSAGLAAREQFRRGVPAWRGPHMMGVVLYVVSVTVPLGIYLLVRLPAWTMLYWVDAGDVSFRHSLWFLIGAPTAGAIGYLISSWLCRRRKPTAAIIACSAGGVALLTAVLLVRERLGRLADETYLQDTGLAQADGLAVVFAFALPVVLGGWAFMLVLYEVEGRKLRRAGEVRQVTRGRTPLPPEAATMGRMGYSGEIGLPASAANGSAPPSTSEEDEPE